MTTTTTSGTDTRPFSPFEWMLASRYLRARRKEGFISVIAGFSFVGIVLGVATLIIVMAVMNGFRHQLFDKILGLNGHAVAFKYNDKGPFDDYNDIVAKLEKVPGVVKAIPLVEGQVLYTSPVQSLGGFVRGLTEAGLRGMPMVAGNITEGTIEGFDNQNGVVVGWLKDLGSISARTSRSSTRRGRGRRWASCRARGRTRSRPSSRWG